MNESDVKAITCLKKKKKILKNEKNFKYNKNKIFFIIFLLNINKTFI
jgi:hypothetical protein